MTTTFPTDTSIASTEPATTDHIDSFGMMLTEQWNVIPTKPEDLLDYRNHLVARLRDEENWTRTDERKLDVMFAKIRTELAKSRAQFAAMFIDTPTAAESGSDGNRVDPPESLPGEILMATVTFGVHTRESLSTELELTPQVLFAAFANRRSAKAPNMRVTDVQPPRFTDLPVGRAVHLRRLYEAEALLSDLPPYFAETFVVPIGSNADACGILQFCTTNLTEAQPFSRVFNQLATTVTLFAESDPTVFNGTVGASR